MFMKNNKIQLKKKCNSYMPLAIQNSYFSILSTDFLIQIPTDSLFHPLFSLNIIFQCFKNEDKSKDMEITQPERLFP